MHALARQQLLIVVGHVTGRVTVRVTFHVTVRVTVRVTFHVTFRVTATVGRGCVPSCRRGAVCRVSQTPSSSPS